MGLSARSSLSVVVPHAGAGDRCHWHDHRQPGRQLPKLKHRGGGGRPESCHSRPGSLYPVGVGCVVGRRIKMLLVVGALIVGACGPSQSERPREGAPVGAGGQPAPKVATNLPVPTLAPPVATGSPAPSPNAAQPALASPSPSPLAGFVIVATDGAGANMRTGPSTTAPVIATLREGTPVEVLGDPVSVEGRLWRQIRSNGRDGWVVAVVVRQR